MSTDHFASDASVVWYIFMWTRAQPVIEFFDPRYPTWPCFFIPVPALTYMYISEWSTHHFKKGIWKWMCKKIMVSFCLQVFTIHQLKNIFELHYPYYNYQYLRFKPFDKSQVFWTKLCKWYASNDFQVSIEWIWRALKRFWFPPDQFVPNNLL